MSAAITRLYRLFPKTTINLASAAVLIMMKRNEDKIDVEGNVFTSSKEPLRVYGKPPISIPRIKLGLALLAGAVVGYTLISLISESNQKAVSKT